jgi:hypothetical protein
MSLSAVLDKTSSPNAVVLPGGLNVAQTVSCVGELDVKPGAGYNAGAGVVELTAGSGGGIYTGLGVYDAYAGAHILPVVAVEGLPPRGLGFQEQISLPVWSATTNWQLGGGGASTNGQYAGFYMVQYGANTSAPGAPPNNIWLLPATGGLGVVNGVPPGTGLPANGWLQLSALITANPTVLYPQIEGVSNGSWGFVKEALIFTGSPQTGDAGIQLQWLGGSDNFGNGGMTLAGQGPNSLNGATLSVDGTIDAYGLALDTTLSDPLGPSCSGAINGVYPTSDGLPFSLGKNYTWAANGTTGTYWFVVNAGSPAPTAQGVSVFSLPAIDPSAIVLVQRELDVGAGVGVLTVSAKTTTTFTVDSRGPTNAILTTDVAFFEWIIINPNWAS